MSNDRSFIDTKAAGVNLLFHRLRYVLGLWIAADLAMYWEEPVAMHGLAYGIVAIFVISQVALFRLKASQLKGLKLYTVVFLLDLFLALGTLLAAGQADTSLLVAAFLSIFIASVVQRLGMAALAALVAAAIYGGMRYMELGAQIMDDYRLLLDLPFILITALHAAITVSEAQFHEEISEALDADNQSLAKKLGNTATELKKKLQFINTIFDGVPTAAILIDADGRIRCFNTGAEQLFLAQRSKVLERGLKEVPFLQPLRKALSDDPAASGGHWLATTKYNRIYAYLRAGSARDADGKLINMTVFLQPAEAPQGEQAPPPLAPPTEKGAPRAAAEPEQAKEAE